MSHRKNYITFLTTTFKNVTYVGIRDALLFHYVYVAATGKITHLLFSHTATTPSRVGTVRNKFGHFVVFLNSTKKCTNKIFFKIIYIYIYTHTHTV